jgi:hypothetical protein
MNLYEDDSMDAIVEAGAIPHLVKLFADQQVDEDVILFTSLAYDDRYCSQMLSHNILFALANQLKKTPSLFKSWEDFCRTISSKASLGQLIPLFSFLLKELPTEVSFIENEEDEDSDDSFEAYQSWLYIPKKKFVERPVIVSNFLLDLIRHSILSQLWILSM